MHIAEGVLTAPVLAAGWAGTIAGLALGLRKMDAEKIPETALLTAALFVASLVHVPVGPANSHLVLNGLAGLLLGWAAFPAVFTALALQAVLFQFGGLTTLGVNTLNIAIPAVAAGFIMRIFINSSSRQLAVVAAGAGGCLAVIGGAFMVALTLSLSGESFINVAKIIFLAHIPVALIEGIVTGTVVSFLLRVKPGMLHCTAGAR